MTIETTSNDINFMDIGVEFGSKDRHI